MFYTYNLTSGEVIIENCNFEGNFGDECGVLVEKQSNGTISFMGSTFTENIVEEYGAALCVTTKSIKTTQM
jgi:hypothetical protein